MKSHQFKYLLLSVFFATLFLYMNLAQANDWILTRCNSIAHVDGTLPPNIRNLSDFYWAVSAQDGASVTETNLGQIDLTLGKRLAPGTPITNALILDHDYKIVYPIWGRVPPSTSFQISNKTRGRYQIEFYRGEFLVSNNILSECKTTVCKCKAGALPVNNPPVAPEEAATTGICSCAVS